VNVADGLFSVRLNKNAQFEVNPFTGLDLWLKIQVKCGGDGSYTLAGGFWPDGAGMGYHLYLPSTEK